MIWQNLCPVLNLLTRKFQIFNQICLFGHTARSSEFSTSKFAVFCAVSSRYLGRLEREILIQNERTKVKLTRFRLPARTSAPPIPRWCRKRAWTRNPRRALPWSRQSNRFASFSLAVLENEENQRKMSSPAAQIWRKWTINCARRRTNSIICPSAGRVQLSLMACRTLCPRDPFFAIKVISSTPASSFVCVYSTLFDFTFYVLYVLM